MTSEYGGRVSFKTQLKLGNNENKNVFWIEPKPNIQNDNWFSSKPETEKQHLLFNWNRLPEFVRFFRLGFVLLL